MPVPAALHQGDGQSGKRGEVVVMRRNGMVWQARSILLMGLVALMMLPALQATTRAQEDVTLTWWWWGTGDIPTMRDWVEWVSAAYEEAHPNVTIVAEERTDADIFTAFEAAAAAHEGPDIAPQWAGMPVMSQVWAGNVAPVSDYVDQAEMGQWLNIGENEFDGKIWAAPIYVVGIPLAYNKELFRQAGLDPEQPMATFDELLAACDALKAAGITPLVGGNRAGYEGSWVFGQLGKQIMDSPNDLKTFILDERDWQDFKPWIARFIETVDRGCWNEDVSSLELQEKYAVFNNGEAAMVWAIDGAVVDAADALGAENIGIVPAPVFGDGEMADWYTATQSISHFITDWSPHKEVAADFMTFWHSPESLAQWFTLTGTMPADSRFDQSAVTDPLKQALFALNQRPSVWLSNFEPPQVFEQADLAGSQLIMSGTGDADEVLTLWQDVSRRWREQRPEEAARFAEWAQKPE